MTQTILVIDDESSLRQALADNFERSGYQVIQAKNGEEGLALALEHHPAVMIIDILMPTMDGLTMLDKLRADEWGKTAKTVVLTNTDEIDNINSALKHGNQHYLIKSETSLESIVTTVESLLES